MAAAIFAGIVSLFVVSDLLAEPSIPLALALILIIAIVTAHFWPETKTVLRGTH